MDNYKVKVISLPYYASNIAMLVFLPDSYDGINQLQIDIQSFNFTQILQKLDSTNVKLALPQFTIDFDVDLQKDLTQVT